MTDQLALPPVEAIDSVPDTALTATLAHLLALQARVVARLTTDRPNDGQGDDRPYTLDEAARLLLKSPAWLRRHAKAGMVPCARKVGKSWLLPRAEFDRFRQRRIIG